MGIGQKIKDNAKRREESEFVKKLTGVVDRIYQSDENVKQREEMERYMKRFQNKWWAKSEIDAGKPDISINLTFATVMTIAPLITDNRPIWNAVARSIYMQDYVTAFKRAGEYLWDKLDMDMKCLEVVLSALIMKKGLVRVYWNAEAEDGKGEVSIDVIDPRTFFVAPGFTDIWEAPMMGTVERKSLAWIRENFPETYEGVQSDESETERAKTSHSWEDFDRFATVYTVWFKSSEMEEYYVNEEGKEVEKGDGEKRERPMYPYGRFVYCTKQKLLGDMKYQYRCGKPPYVDLVDYKVPFNFWSMGEIDQIESINKYVNEITQKLVIWATSYCDPPWLIDANAMLNAEQVKESIKNGGGAYLYNGTVNPKPIAKADSPNISPVVPNAIQMLGKMNEEVSGVTDISKGMTTKAQEQSATEISTLIESSYTRTRQRVRNYEFFLKRVYYLVIELMQQFYTEPREFNYASPDLDGQRVWGTVGNSKAQADAIMRPRESPGAEQMMDNPDLAADIAKEEEYYRDFIEAFGTVDEVYAGFDIEIQTNSTLPMDKQSQANLFLRLLQIGAGNPVTGMPMWEAVLENMRIPNYKKIIAKMNQLFAAQNQPQAQGAPV